MTRSIGFSRAVRLDEDETLRSWSRADRELLPSDVEAIRPRPSQPQDLAVTGGN